MLIWRIAKPDLALKLDGETNRLRGGRWHSPGHGVIVTARALSTLVLEVMAELPPGLRFDWPVYAAVALEIGEDVSVRRVSRTAIDEAPDPAARRRAIGDAWLADAQFPLLEVPASVVPQDTLILIDPRHEAFGRGQIRVAHVEPLALDPRLHVPAKAPLIPRSPR